MIRFRLGQRWKRERAAAPADSFELELDGVALLAEASDELLSTCVLGLAEAMRRLLVGDRFAQLSLPEAHLELVFARREDMVDLKVVSLARPARLAKPTVQVGLTELRHAVVRCGQNWISELKAMESGQFRPTPELTQAIGALDGASVRPCSRPVFQGAFGYERFAPDVGVGFQLLDAEDLLLSYRKAQGAALGPLLMPGELSLKLGEELLPASTPTLFLSTLEMGRQAMELVRAVEFDEPAAKLTLGGILPPLTLSLRDGRGTVANRSVPLGAEQLARAIFEAGLELAFALHLRNPALAYNPYVSDLSTLCRQGLAQLRGASAPAGPGAARPQRKAARAAQAPLPTSGRLKRLRFAPLWSSRVGSEDLSEDFQGTLMLSPHGVVAVTQGGAFVVSAQGKQLAARAGSLGTVALADGSALCAFEDRMLGYHGIEPNARWLRSHDGELLDAGVLTAVDGLWIARSESRSVLAYQKDTGRELWRLTPPGGQRAYLSVQAHRALLTTDAGYLYGFDLTDALVRFRSRTSLPFQMPTVPWGRRFVALAQDRHIVQVSVIDAHTGQLSWSEELPLENASRPVVRGNLLYLAGEHGGHPLILAMSPFGKRLWHRPLPHAAEPQTLLATPSGLILTGHSGVCTKLSKEGEIQWILGARSRALSAGLAPVLSRGVLLIPGETVRALDPKSGSLLTEVEVGHGLAGFAVDPKLTLYTLTDDGVLKAHKLTTQLAVVEG